MTTSRSSLRDWFGTFSTNIVLLAIGVVTGIVAARTLGPSGRGFFAEILLWGSLVAQLGGFGLPSAVTVEAARYGQSQRLFVTVFLLSCLIASTSIVVFMTLAHFFVKTSYEVTRYVAVYVPIYILGISFLSLEAGAQRFKRLNAMRLVPQSVYLVLMLTLAALGRASAVSFAWSLAVGSALVPFVRSAAAGRQLLHRPDIAAARRLLVSGLQFYIPSVMNILRESCDKILILSLLDHKALGLYAVGLTIAGSAINNVAGATTTILLPKTLGAVDDQARARQIATATSASLLVATLINAVIAMAAPFLIPFLFGHEFAGAVPITAALCLAQITRSGNDILASGLRGYDDWLAMPLTAGVALTLFVPFAYVGASAYGVAGVAVALAVANVGALLFVLERVVRRTGLPAVDFLVPPKWVFSPTNVWARLRLRGI